jgi:ribosomal protein S12 methylthiotransferase accessory factor
MEIMVTFPGGKKVDAEVNGMVITTDQPKLQGGEGTAPSPFVHFLASIGTCAGIYVLSFCQERGIPTDKITLLERLEYTTTEDGKSILSKILLDINVPPDFPEKYHKALLKVADQCAVKKTILHPPQFEIKTNVRQ